MTIALDSMNRTICQAVNFAGTFLFTLEYGFVKSSVLFIALSLVALILVIKHVS